MGWDSTKTLDTGQIAPDFRLELAGGSFTSLDDLLAGGPVLLAFYKVSCPTCQLTLPFLQRLQGGRFRVFAVCQDSAGRAREFGEAFDVNLPNLLDKDEDGYPVSNAFGITHVPAMFLVEPDKRISWAWTGFHKRKLEELARSAGKEIFHAADRVPESKPG